MRRDDEWQEFLCGADSILHSPFSILYSTFFIFLSFVQKYFVVCFLFFSFSIIFANE